MSFSPPPPRVSPPPPRVSPPPFEFKGLPLSEHSADIYSVISQLSSSSLTPRELLHELEQPRMRIPMGIDVNDLGHAYYSYYWQPYVKIKTSASSKLKIKSDQIGEPVKVPNVTAPQDDHADINCNQEYGPNYIMSPEVFAKALMTISPRELKSQYYHHPSICGTEFNEFLRHMNQIIRAYFETPAYAVGPEMNQLLNGIIKCICLRVLSRSAYHYAHKAKHEVNDAMNHLLEFYKMTDLIHAWDETSFYQHVQIIRKYDVLKMFIDKLVALGPSFLSTHYFTFREVTNNLHLVLFDDLYKELAHFTCESFPHCITVLKRNISSDDILHSIQLLSGSLNDKGMVDAGLILLQFLVNRIKQDNALSRDTKDDYDVAHEVFQMTGQAIDQLPVDTHPHEHESFVNFGNEIIAMTRFRKSKREKVYPLRMHSSPFQALIISPRMFRAGRNAPPRVSPAPLRVSPPPLHVSHHGSHRESNTRKRRRGGAKSKKRSKKFLIRK
jgi:hypothetical protein